MKKEKEMKMKWTNEQVTELEMKVNATIDCSGVMNMNENGKEKEM